MGEWYWIGLAVGVGAAFGLLFAGVFSTTRAGAVGAILLGAAAGVGVGFGLDDWDEALGGGLGGLGGALGSAQVVRGALGRGGTRGGAATPISVAALGVGALAPLPRGGD